jgi:hypothetical protein
MVPGKYWHIWLADKRFGGKHSQAKLGLNLIEWNDAGQTTQIGAFEPSLEKEDGTSIPITACYIKDGLLFVDTKMATLVYEVEYGHWTTEVGNLKVWEAEKYLHGLGRRLYFVLGAVALCLIAGAIGLAVSKRRRRNRAVAQG